MDNNDKYITINNISTNITYFKPLVYSTRKHRVNNVFYNKNNSDSDQDECIEKLRHSTQPRKLVHHNKNKIIF